MNREDAGLAFLEHLNEAVRLNQWIYDYVKPYLGVSVLEVGCGIGNITEFLVSKRNRNVTAIDIEPKYVEIVKEKFGADPGFRALQGDITDPDFINALSATPFDTVVCLNVLEHIEEDEQTLVSFHRLLAPEGRLVLLCPAHRVLFGSMDRHLGHYRRYHRKGLQEMVIRVGFKPLRAFHFNSFSVPGWFINGKMLHSHHASPLQVKIVEAIVPFFRFFEDRVKLPFGLSVLVIAEK